MSLASQVDLLAAAVRNKFNSQKTIIDGKAPLLHTHGFINITGSIRDVQLPGRIQAKGDVTVAGDDFDDNVEFGTYLKSSSALNNPGAGAWGILYVESPDENYVIQTFSALYGASGDEVRFRRHYYYDSGWGDWYRLRESEEELDARYSLVGHTHSGYEPSFGSGTTSQYLRGDKTWQTFNKAAIGLSNVDNTSDVNKPVSTATSTALNLKADLVGAGFTGYVTVTKTGSGTPSFLATNVANSNRGVALSSGSTRAGIQFRNNSTAHAGISSDGSVIYFGPASLSDDPSTWGTPVASLSAAGTFDAVALTQGGVAVASTASPTFTGTVSGITKTMVGLGNVDNTSDANKPVSTAQQTALNLKANLASPTFTGTVSGITATMVGLGNVSNIAQVDTANNQSISGVKTFSASPIVPTPTTSTQAANKSYVDTFNNRQIVTSGTRPGSPYEGLEIYESDTDRTYTYINSAYVEQTNIKIGELGYAQNTATAQTWAHATKTDLTGCSVTVTVGSRPIKITAQMQLYKSAADGFATYNIGYIREGSTDIDQGQITQTYSNFHHTLTWSVRLSPSSGSHTYKLSAQTFGTGSGVSAGGSNPAAVFGRNFILVEEM